MGKNDTQVKYALVTGGSRGIGRAVCVKLAQMGYNILINCVSNEAEAQKTLELVRQNGQDGEILKFDVANREQVSHAIEAWENAHPEEYIEVLVNNAGIRRDDVLVFMAEDEWHSVLDTTLGGFYNVTQAVLQQMLTYRYGRIINMASVSGLKGACWANQLLGSKGGHHRCHQGSGTRSCAQRCHRQCRRPRIHRNRHDRGARR